MSVTTSLFRPTMLSLKCLCIFGGFQLSYSVYLVWRNDWSAFTGEDDVDGVLTPEDIFHTQSNKTESIFGITNLIFLSLFLCSIIVGRVVLSDSIVSDGKKQKSSNFQDHSCKDNSHSCKDENTCKDNSRKNTENVIRLYKILTFVFFLYQVAMAVLYSVLLRVDYHTFLFFYCSALSSGSLVYSILSLRESDQNAIPGRRFRIDGDSSFISRSDMEGVRFGRKKQDQIPLLSQNIVKNGGGPHSGRNMSEVVSPESRANDLNVVSNHDHSGMLYRWDSKSTQYTLNGTRMDLPCSINGIPLERAADSLDDSCVQGSSIETETQFQTHSLNTSQLDDTCLDTTTCIDSQHRISMESIISFRDFDGDLKPFNSSSSSGKDSGGYYHIGNSANSSAYYTACNTANNSANNSDHRYSSSSGESQSFGNHDNDCSGVVQARPILEYHEKFNKNLNNNNDSLITTISSKERRLNNNSTLIDNSIHNEDNEDNEDDELDNIHEELDDGELYNEDNEDDELYNQFYARKTARTNFVFTTLFLTLIGVSLGYSVCYAEHISLQKIQDIIQWSSPLYPKSILQSKILQSTSLKLNSSRKSTPPLSPPLLLGKLGSTISTTIDVEKEGPSLGEDNNNHDNMMDTLTIVFEPTGLTGIGIIGSLILFLVIFGPPYLELVEFVENNKLIRYYHSDEENSSSLMKRKILIFYGILLAFLMSLWFIAIIPPHITNIIQNSRSTVNPLIINSIHKQVMLKFGEYCSGSDIISEMLNGDCSGSEMLNMSSEITRRSNSCLHYHRILSILKDFHDYTKYRGGGILPGNNKCIHFFLTFFSEEVFSTVPPPTLNSVYYLDDLDLEIPRSPNAGVQNKTSNKREAETEAESTSIVVKDVEKDMIGSLDEKQKRLLAKPLNRRQTCSLSKPGFASLVFPRFIDMMITTVMMQPALQGVKENINSLNDLPRYFDFKSRLVSLKKGYTESTQVLISPSSSPVIISLLSISIFVLCIISFREWRKPVTKNDDDLNRDHGNEELRLYDVDAELEFDSDDETAPVKNITSNTIPPTILTFSSADSGNIKESSHSYNSSYNSSYNPHFPNKDSIKERISSIELSEILRWSKEEFDKITTIQSKNDITTIESTIKSTNNDKNTRNRTNTNALSNVLPSVIRSVPLIPNIPYKSFFGYEHKLFVAVEYLSKVKNIPPQVYTNDYFFPKTEKKIWKKFCFDKTKPLLQGKGKLQDFSIKNFSDTFLTNSYSSSDISFKNISFKNDKPNPKNDKIIALELKLRRSLNPIIGATLRIPRDEILSLNNLLKKVKLECRKDKEFKKTLKEYINSSKPITLNNSSKNSSKSISLDNKNNKNNTGSTLENSGPTGSTLENSGPSLELILYRFTVQCNSWWEKPMSEVFTRFKNTLYWRKNQLPKLLHYSLKDAMNDKKKLKKFYKDGIFKTELEIEKMRQKSLEERDKKRARGIFEIDEEEGDIRIIEDGYLDSHGYSEIMSPDVEPTNPYKGPFHIWKYMIQVMYQEMAERIKEEELQGKEKRIEEKERIKEEELQEKEKRIEEKERIKEEELQEKEGEKDRIEKTRGPLKKQMTSEMNSKTTLSSRPQTPSKSTGTPSTSEGSPDVLVAKEAISKAIIVEKANEKSTIVEEVNEKTVNGHQKDNTAETIEKDNTTKTVSSAAEEPTEEKRAKKTVELSLTRNNENLPLGHLHLRILLSDRWTPTIGLFPFFGVQHKIWLADDGIPIEIWDIRTIRSQLVTKLLSDEEIYRACVHWFEHRMYCLDQLGASAPYVIMNFAKFEVWQIFKEAMYHKKIATIAAELNVHYPHTHTKAFLAETPNWMRTLWPIAKKICNPPDATVFMSDDTVEVIFDKLCTCEETRQDMRQAWKKVYAVPYGGK